MSLKWSLSLERETSAYLPLPGVGAASTGDHANYNLMVTWLWLKSAVNQ